MNAKLPRGRNKHHLKPRSRFAHGASKYQKDHLNIVELPVEFHRAFHIVFGNLDPQESEEFLRRVLQPGLSWNGQSLEQLRQQIMEETRERKKRL